MINKNIQDTCIIDARISTDKQLQNFSLDDQEIICKRYALNHGWNVLKTFSKSYSGRKEMREDFVQIISYIKKLQKGGIQVDYYLIKSIDRFTRLGSGVYEEMKVKLNAIGVQLIDAYGVIQPELNKLDHLGIEYSWSKQSATQIAQVIEAERARQEVSDILVRMIGAEISLTQAGYKIRQPNDGFKNKGIFVEGKKVTIQVRDPERAFFYEMMFKLRARGELKDKEIVREINDMGFLSRERKRWKKEGKKKFVIGITPGKPLTIKQLQKVIQKPAYAGITCEKWTHFKPIWSKSEKLVDIDTFNKANRGKVFIKAKEDGTPAILYNYDQDAKPIKKRKKYNPLFLYDKMILCPECKLPFKSSSSTGKMGKKFPAYHCARNHKRISANKATFERNITKYLNQIKFKPGFLDLFETVLLSKYRHREAEIVAQAVVMGKNVAELKDEQAQLLRSFNLATSDVVRKKLEIQIDELENRIQPSTKKRDEIEITERDIKEFIKQAKDLMEHPGKTVGDNKNPYLQRQIFSLIFDTPPTYAEIINGTPKLSLFFRLSEEFKTSNSALVSQQGLGWNSCAILLRKWRFVFEEVEVRMAA